MLKIFHMAPLISLLKKIYQAYSDIIPFLGQSKFNPTWDGRWGGGYLFLIIILVLCVIGICALWILDLIKF